MFSLHDPGENSITDAEIRQFLQQSDFMSKQGIKEDSVKFARTVMCNDISVAEAGNEFGINSCALYENISRINHSCAPNCV